MSTFNPDGPQAPNDGPNFGVVFNLDGSISSRVVSGGRMVASGILEATQDAISAPLGGSAVGQWYFSGGVWGAK